MLTITAQTPMPTRFHPRVDVGFMVKLMIGGKSLVVKAEDVSMAGCRLVGDFPDLHGRVTICLPLPEGEQIVTEATVRHRTAEGLGLEFDDLDWDEMFVMARFLHPRLP